MFLQYGKLTKSDYLKEKAAVVTTILCCSDLIILLSFHSPNYLPFNKSQKCFLLKILILLSHNLGANLSAVSPLRFGKFHRGKAGWSAYRAQRFHVLWPASPQHPAAERWVLIFTCWHLVFCKPESLILQEAMAPADASLVQAHRCAMMLSALIEAPNYCCWLHGYLIQAIFGCTTCAAFHISDWRKKT